MLTMMDMETGMFAKKEVPDEYGQEILKGEWNPVLPMLHVAVAELANEMVARNALPVDLREADVEAFLRNMYAAQG